jgi:hypothetical protein
MDRKILREREDVYKQCEQALSTLAGKLNLGAIRIYFSAKGISVRRFWERSVDWKSRERHSRTAKRRSRNV